MKSTNSLLEFQFKGNRNYVHGTDIFTRINEAISEDEGAYIAKLKFINLLKFNARIEWVSAKKSENLGESDVCAVGEILLKTGQSQKFNIISISDRKISDRYEYPEDQIVSKLVMDSKSACLNHSTGFSLIEEAVASIKYLSNVLEPPKSGKWLFAGIQLKNSMQKSRNFDQTLKVVQRQIIAKRFSKNDVYIDDMLLGVIEFSVRGV